MNKLWTLITQAFQNVVAIFQGVTQVPFPILQSPQTQRKEFSVEVVRPDDLLVLTLDFYNLKIKSPAGVPRIEKLVGGNGFIVARFPPQSVVEQAFFEAAEGSPAAEPGDPPLPSFDDPLLGPPVASRIAGPSQLVFRISDAQLPIDFKLEELLHALEVSEPIVQPRILRPREVPAIGEVTQFGGTDSQYSAIEAPIRLILSPNAESRWLHKEAPAKSKDLKRTELWHTRLEGKKKSVSAVWSPDYRADNVDPPADDTHPFRMSMHAENRHQIVRSTADPDLVGAKPAPVNQLLLSSQGAWLDLHGKWATELPLVEWRHIMTAGRDQYVRIVKEGNLFWGCHRAVFIKITERKIQMATSPTQLEGKPAAYLRQRYLIIVKEPTRTYTHRHFPYRSVTIKTLVTPNLDLPEGDDIFNKKENAFWPKVLGKDFEFQIVATDWEGRVSEFGAPMAFIVKTIGNDPAQMNPIIDDYNTHLSDKAHWERELYWQKIAYAPPVEPGDTTLETKSMIFNAMRSGGSPRFLPMMFTSQVDLPAVRHISGNSAPSTIKLDEDFAKASGQFGNWTDTFAHVVSPKTAVTFSSDKTGGMVAPNFNIAGISRAFGPVGANDIKQFSGGTFNPGEMFASVKLLGGIPLSSIIKGMDNATPEVSGNRIPQLQSVQTKVDGKDVIQTSYRWDLGLEGLATTDVFKPEGGAKFFIAATVNAPLDGSTPQVEIRGELTNFKVILLPASVIEGCDFVELSFTSVTFVAKPNTKVDFGIVFNKFAFTGILEFVNRLAAVIPSDGFDDPPFLKLSLPPEKPGVLVGFTLGLPSVGIGIFTLQNISFGASFFLPFLGDPANLRLNFCERHQPFILTVSLFGGGGFFGIDIGFEGVKQIEAALEFGASIALNLGVASGSASIMGGVYYRSTGSEFEFSAYFRAAGSLSILGIITLSVELYLALTFTSKALSPHGGKLWGQASITVKIKIVFFSVKVSVGIEREFAGSDPKFIEAVSPGNWIDYCESFANYPV